MSEKPGSECTLSRWDAKNWVVLSESQKHGTFCTLTSLDFPMFDFDQYSNFTKQDILNDIIRACKEHKIDHIVRLYETCKGVRMILPYTKFKTTNERDEFIAKIPHHDPLYLEYLKESNLYRARLSPKVKRVPVGFEGNMAVTRYKCTIFPSTKSMTGKRKRKWAKLKNVAVPCSHFVLKRYEEGLPITCVAPKCRDYFNQAYYPTVLHAPPHLLCYITGVRCAYKMSFPVHKWCRICRRWHRKMSILFQHDLYTKAHTKHSTLF